MKCVANNPACVAGLVMMIKYTHAEVCEPCRDHREKIAKATAEANKRGKSNPQEAVQESGKVSEKGV